MLEIKIESCNKNKSGCWEETERWDHISTWLNLKQPNMNICGSKISIKSLFHQGLDPFFFDCIKEQSQRQIRGTNSVSEKRQHRKLKYERNISTHMHIFDFTLLPTVVCLSVYMSTRNKRQIWNGRHKRNHAEHKIEWKHLGNSIYVFTKRCPTTHGAPSRHSRYCY